MGVVPDERLARRAARGDRRAFEAIYRRYNQPLYRFCLAMVGDTQDAQDALQNTMVKMLKALPGEERQIRLKPWLYRIARNESVELLRRRRETVRLDPEQEATKSLADTAEARERLRHLLDDLEQLHERLRAVLVMRELSGLDFAEIGVALDTSPAAARQALYEARVGLRQMEAGREMRCTDVMRELSDADGRVVRRREIRAHLRGCAECRAFREEIGRRRGELAAIAPLPLAASTGLLQAVLGAKAGAGAAGAGAGAGTGAAVATSTIVKSAATVAVTAVVGVTAADRGGLVELPVGIGDHRGEATSEATRSSPRRGFSPPGSSAPAGTSAARVASGRAAENGESPKTHVPNPDPADRLPRAIAPSPASGDTPGASPSGVDPPGGGHGATSIERRGKPGALPAAAGHGQGQRTAAGRPANAGEDPRGASKRDGKERSHGGAPPATKQPPPKSPKPAPHPLAPPSREKGPPTGAPSRRVEHGSSGNPSGGGIPLTYRRQPRLNGRRQRGRPPADNRGGTTMKLQVKIALATVALALFAAPTALAVTPHEGTPPHGKGQAKGKGPSYTPAPPPLPGPKDGLPAQAKAYGRYCQGESKKHVKGEKGTEFSRCVRNMARAANQKHKSPGQICQGESKKHVKGEKGTEFSRCVTAVAKLREDQAS